MNSYIELKKHFDEKEYDIYESSEYSRKKYHRHAPSKVATNVITAASLVIIIGFVALVGYGIANDCTDTQGFVYCGLDMK